MPGWDAHNPSHNVLRLEPGQKRCIQCDEIFERKATDENALQALGDDEYCSVACVLIAVDTWRKKCDSEFARGRSAGIIVGRQQIEYQLDQVRAEAATYRRNFYLASQVIGTQPDLTIALQKSLEMVKGTAA